MNKRSGIESKKRIIDAAMSVFSRHGYAKANIRDIAGTAGISVGGVYLYFKNKEELYKSIIKEGMRDFGGKIETITAQAKSATEALSNFLKLHLENTLRHKEFILLHIREHGFTFAMDKKKQFLRRQQKLIEKIVLSGIRSGEFRRCNAKEMSNIIMATLRGTILSIAIDGDVIVSSRGLSEFVLKGLLRKDRKE
jgi:AcrR family transcriptional regulator